MLASVVGGVLGAIGYLSTVKSNNVFLTPECGTPGSDFLGCHVPPRADPVALATVVLLTAALAIALVLAVRTRRHQ